MLLFCKVQHARDNLKLYIRIRVLIDKNFSTLVSQVVSCTYYNKNVDNFVSPSYTVLFDLRDNAFARTEEVFQALAFLPTLPWRSANEIYTLAESKTISRVNL